ncbi:MAG: hypothetical protein NT027_11665 [Proteobacteria bacterium]|nr:hypothetical protein [Pseudomonadota bacterium]
MTGKDAILFIETPGQPSLPAAASMFVASFGARMISTTSVEQGCSIIDNLKDEQLLAVVSNTASIELFQKTRQSCHAAQNILITADTIFSYSEDLKGLDSVLIDHVIANTTSEWVNNELRVTLQKIIKRDIFGVDKYLNSQNDIQCITIKTSKDRDHCNQVVQKWVESCGFGKNVGRLAFGITEELLMNAIYDAPVAGGRKHYEELERTAHRELQPDEYGKLTYGTDGKTLALSISDPFGAFQREKWWQYVRKILRRDDPDSLIDTKKGGAGLGIFKMLYSSHGVVCNVQNGRQTEVIVLIDLSQPIRDFSGMPRSMHYFNLDSAT